MIRDLLLCAAVSVIVSLAVLGLAPSLDLTAERERIRDCITSGEPATTDDWLAFTLECTE